LLTPGLVKTRIKLPAGIFIPTLAVGALAGRSAGLVVEWLHAQYPSSFIFEACRLAGGEDGPLPFGQACVIPGVWSIVGAAAALAGVTRTTVSLAVICFELTGASGFCDAGLGVGWLIATILAFCILQAP
jgi:chloride channel 3/4/5